MSDTKISKASIARTIYQRERAKGTTRKDIIQLFQTEAGLTAAGASTYFQNFFKAEHQPAKTIIQPAQAPTTIIEQVEQEQSTITPTETKVIPTTALDDIEEQYDFDDLDDVTNQYTLDEVA
jgi:hypothetical protein